MRIRVKWIDRRNSIDVNTHAFTTVVNLKQIIARETGMNLQQFRLFFRGCELESNHRLTDFDIADGNSVYLAVKGPINGTPDMGLERYGAATWTPKLESLMTDARNALFAGKKPRLSEDGEGGTYFLKGVDDEYICCFKPQDEEAFAPNNPKSFVGKLGHCSLRKGILSGEAFEREIAAFMLDHKGMAGVPHTGLVEAWHPVFNNNRGKITANIQGAITDERSSPDVSSSPDKPTVERKIGSLQEFVKYDSMVGDWAPNKFPVKEVQKIAILDMRLLNTDRNDANVLLKWVPGENGEQVPFLIPIDHGYCMPDNLEVAWCDWVWFGWPQIREPIDPELKEYVRNLDIERDIRYLRSQLSIREECLQNIRVTGTVLKTGIEAGLNLYDIACILCRQELDTPSPVECLVDRVNRISKEFEYEHPDQLPEFLEISSFSPKEVEESSSTGTPAESMSNRENSAPGEKKAVDFDPEESEHSAEGQGKDLGQDEKGEAAETQQDTGGLYNSKDAKDTHDSEDKNSEGYEEEQDDLFLPPTPSRKPIEASLRIELPSLDDILHSPLPPSPVYSEHTDKGHASEEELLDNQSRRRGRTLSRESNSSSGATTPERARSKLPDSSPLKLNRSTLVALAAASAKSAARAAAAIPGRQSARIDVRKFVKVPRLVDASDKLRTKTGLVLCIGTAMSTDAHLLRPIEQHDHQTNSTNDKVIQGDPQLSRYDSVASREGEKSPRSGKSDSSSLSRPAGAVTAVSVSCIWGGRLTTVVVTPQGRDVVFLTESETDNALGQAVAAALSAAATARLSLLESTALGLRKAATMPSDGSDAGSTKLSSMYTEEVNDSQSVSASSQENCWYTERPLMRCLLASIKEFTGQSYIRPESHFYSYLSGINENWNGINSDDDVGSVRQEVELGGINSDTFLENGEAWDVSVGSPTLSRRNVPLASAQSAPLDPVKADMHAIPSLDLEPSGFTTTDQKNPGGKGTRYASDAPSDGTMKPHTMRRQVHRSQFRKGARQRSYSFHGDSPVHEEDAAENDANKRSSQERRQNHHKNQKRRSKQKRLGQRVEAASKWLGSETVRLEKTSSYTNFDDTQLPESDVLVNSHSTYIQENSSTPGAGNRPARRQTKSSNAPRKRLFRNNAFAPDALNENHAEGKDSNDLSRGSTGKAKRFGQADRTDSVVRESGSRFVGYDGVNRAVLARQRSYENDDSNPCTSSKGGGNPDRLASTGHGNKSSGESKFSIAMVPISGGGLSIGKDEESKVKQESDDPVENFDLSPLNVVVTVLGPSPARPDPSMTDESLVLAAQRMGQRAGQEALQEAGYPEEVQHEKEGSAYHMNGGWHASVSVSGNAAKTGSIALQNVDGTPPRSEEDNNRSDNEVPRNSSNESSTSESNQEVEGILKKSKQPWKPRWKREGFRNPSPEARPPPETDDSVLDNSPPKSVEASPGSSSGNDGIGFDRASPGELNPESLPPTAIDRTFNAPRTRNAMKRSIITYVGGHGTSDDTESSVGKGSKQRSGEDVVTKFRGMSVKKNISRTASYSSGLAKKDRKTKLSDQDSSSRRFAFGKQSKFFGQERDVVSPDSEGAENAQETKSTKVNVGAIWSPFFKSCFEKQLRIFLENKSKNLLGGTMV
eukprot:gb/GECG01012238.1/.p1 GENE.gb/GECG01012238.1/~~gb/GECG01012238.1/.p1  ORF type:complete len:1628 (+),score=251.68 gb/GECG01012238.1/:1-4884(+)